MKQAYLALTSCTDYSLGQQPATDNEAAGTTQGVSSLTPHETDI